MLSASICFETIEAKSYMFLALLNIKSIVTFLDRIEFIISLLFIPFLIMNFPGLILFI